MIKRETSNWESLSEKAGVSYKRRVISDSRGSLFKSRLHPLLFPPFPIRMWVLCLTFCRHSVSHHSPPHYILGIHSMSAQDSQWFWIRGKFTICRSIEVLVSTVGLGTCSIKVIDVAKHLFMHVTAAHPKWWSLYKCPLCWDLEAAAAHKMWEWGACSYMCKRW